MHISAQQVATKIRDAGFSVFRVSEPDDLEDGTVDLLHGYAIQVGFGYMLLNRYEYNQGELVSVKHVLNIDNVDTIITYMKNNSNDWK